MTIGQAKICTIQNFVRLGKEGDLNVTEEGIAPSIQEDPLRLIYGIDELLHLGLFHKGQIDHFEMGEKYG